LDQRDQPQKPYKGLIPYSEEDAQYFFGRERESKIILANSMASRLTLLYGASGVGKSSVLGAGVGHALTNLAQQNLEALGTPEYLGIKFSSWRDDPVSGLLKRVQESIEQFPTTKPGPTVSSSQLSESLHSCAAHANATLLIILDQFEEYFLYHPREFGKGSFAVEFARAVNSSALAANFLISIREDGLAKLDQFREYIPNLFENYLRLDHLDRKAAREAIENPVIQYNRAHPAGEPFTIAPALIERVLQGVKTGQQLFSGSGLGVAASKSSDERIETPLLQIIMRRLWDEEWRLGSRQLRVQTLEDLKGTEEIIKSHLDFAMANLNRDEQRTISRIFNQLVTPSGSKIAHTSADLAAYSGQPEAEVAEVLDKLSSGDARLLRTVPPPFNQLGAPPRYEIFHDVLAVPVLEWRRRFELEEEREKANQIVREYVAPLGDVKDNEPSGRVRSGIALSLSGGGYRGMLFNLGALWRLNELGLLKRIARISSVSGGAITAGMLGLVWSKLDFGTSDTASNFEQLVVKPIRSLARFTIKTKSFFSNYLPGRPVPNEAVSAFRNYLFENATLQDLPAEPPGPRFIITATNVQSKALWRFSKPYMGDYRVGYIRNPMTEIAVAVGAAAAYPPHFSPVILKLEPAEFDPTTKGDLQFEPYTSSVVLTDGAVYDTFGLETVWKVYDTLLVSDGSPGTRVAEPTPPTDALRHSSSTVELIINQVRSLRKRQLMDSYNMNLRKGAYWGMQTNILDYQLPTAMDCPFEKTLALAHTPARFSELNTTLQEQIINWGYAVCDAAIRAQVDKTAPIPISFPYPGGVG
jgi:NTE family protein